MSPALLWALVALAGAAGAVCRYVVDYAVGRRWGAALPWGTLAVNVTGSFLFGLVAGVAGRSLPGEAELVLAVGFCGAYTTFSTHMTETAWLALEGRRTAAALGVLGSLAAGVAAATLGLAVTR